MNVIVHYPTSAAGKQALAETVASVHAQAVLHKLQSLTCPKEQGVDIIRELIVVSQSLGRAN